MNETRLDGFLRSHGITTSSVARGTGYHRNHVTRVRKGLAEPTRECMAEILAFLRGRVGTRVHVEDLFDLGRRSRRAS